jgi:hypothetical protein
VSQNVRAPLERRESGSDVFDSPNFNHPHVHMIVPGGGVSDDGTRWIGSRANFLVHVRS